MGDNYDEIWDEEPFGMERPGSFVSPLDSEKYTNPIFPDQIRYAWALPPEVYGSSYTIHGVTNRENDWVVYFFGDPDSLPPDSAPWSLGSLLGEEIIYLGARIWKDSLRSHIGKKRMWHILEARNSSSTVYLELMQDFWNGHLGRVSLSAEEYRKTEFWKILKKEGKTGNQGLGNYKLYL